MKTFNIRPRAMTFPIWDDAVTAKRLRGLDDIELRSYAAPPRLMPKRPKRSLSRRQAVMIGASLFMVAAAVVTCGALAAVAGAVSLASISIWGALCAMTFGGAATVSVGVSLFGMSQKRRANPRAPRRGRCYGPNAVGVWVTVPQDERVFRNILRN